MCGIVGIRRFDGAPVNVSLLREMASLIAHRGPDDEGFWCSGPIGFGHRRLSIIDLAGSPQPMASVDGSCHLTFNGEILNYRSLRRRFPYPYRTEGDTETILATYLALGEAGIGELEGQFAFALHDARDGSLWLARDRMGILPLYYYVDDKLFAFASEIKALLPAIPAVNVDLASLDAYLAQSAVPAPYTLFEGVRKLPPASVLRIDERGIAQPRRYWSIPVQQDTTITPDAAVEELSKTLKEAVSTALVADVPVGAYLSGGVDSSLIVALMSELRGRAGVQTFAAGFDDARNDELPYARHVSQLLGTEHHEVVIAPDDFRSLWHELTWHRDAPISQSADMAVFRLAQLARRNVTVILSGEGSDELFAGYPKHRYAGISAHAGIVPTAIRAPALSMLERYLPGGGGRLRVALRALAGHDEAERFRTWFAPFTARERKALLGGKPQHPIDNSTQNLPGDALNRMLAADLRTWLCDNLLERGDRMSMATSLELRPPFLDRRVVELAFTLPSNLKVRGGTTKWLVKQVARRLLPSEIVDRRKVGFRVPLDAWFRGGLESFAWDLLISPNSFASTQLDRKAIRSLLERHRTSTTNEEFRIWNLLCLEIWHDVFFRRRRDASESLRRAG